jgi:hypothetical protein
MQGTCDSGTEAQLENVVTDNCFFGFNLDSQFYLPLLRRRHQRLSVAVNAAVEAAVNASAPL